MTDIQQLILQCFVIEPEDKAAFKKARKQAKNRRYSERHREENKERCRVWRKNNPEKAKAASEISRAKKPEQYAAVKKLWVSKNRGTLNEQSLAWYRRNKGQAQASNSRCKKRRHNSDPNYRVECSLRSRIYNALKGGRGAKSARTFELLGCTPPEFRAHLEAQFRPGMTWENYGPVWHIDHVRPCASFDLADPAQQRDCFNWSNTQPLFAEENLKKGSR